MKDLHIHIERGDYNAEWIKKFVDKAVSMNIDEINLLEHSVRIKEFHPCFKEACEYSSYQNNWFKEKVPNAHNMQEYQNLICEIKSLDLPVKVNFGMEICWFEQHEDFIRDLVNYYDFDYVLGSVHWIDNWTFNQRKYQWLGKDVNKIYKRYYEMSESLIKSDIFDIIAHPDLIRCQNLYPDYSLKETYREFCKNAKAHNIAVEMNTAKGLGLNDEFLEIALKSKVKFSVGSDAHRPQDVGRGIAEIYSKIKGADIL